MLVGQFALSNWYRYWAGIYGAMGVTAAPDWRCVFRTILGSLEVAAKIGCINWSPRPVVCRKDRGSLPLRSSGRATGIEEYKTGVALRGESFDQMRTLQRILIDENAKVALPIVYLCFSAEYVRQDASR
jgi:hypothetical protein